MRKRVGGFTLIEAVVVAGLVSIIMLIVSFVLSNSLKSSTRIETTSELENSATWMMDLIKQSVLNASPGSLVCPSSGVGSSFSFINKEDKNGGVTSIYCVENTKIASASANPAQLSPQTIQVTGCDTFVSNCDSRGLELNFAFSMGGGLDPLSAYKRTFTSRITIRQ